MDKLVELNKDIYKKVLQKIAHNEGIEIVSIESSAGSKKGDNYSGQIYRVCVTGARQGIPIKLNLIMKTSSDDFDRNELPAQEFYKREIFFYRTILPELEILQESKNIEPLHRFSFVKCFYTHDVLMEELVVLEDLKTQGFMMADRLKSVDFPHCALLMEALGKLHALSYVMKKTKPEKFQHLTDKCCDLLCNGRLANSIEKLFDDMAYMFLSVIQSEEVKAKLENFATHINERMKVSTESNNFSVLGHGDCWTNNMLFKYKNGVPVDIRLLDFQLARFCSPALDILYFIFSCTDRDFRSQYYSSVLDLYYNSLSASLKAHSLDVEDFLTKEDFLSEIKRNSDYGLGMAILTLRAFVSDPDDVPDFESIMSNDEDTQKITLPTGAGYDRYLQRANEVAEDYVNYGYLN